MGSLSEYAAVELAVQTGCSYADRLNQLETELLAEGLFVKKSSPFYDMSKNKQATPEAINRYRQSQLLLDITRALNNNQ